MKLTNELSKAPAMMSYPLFQILVAIGACFVHYEVGHQEEEDKAEQGGGKGLLMLFSITVHKPYYVANLLTQ